jgi:hypothetical protein
VGKVNGEMQFFNSIEQNVDSPIAQIKVIRS